MSMQALTDFAAEDRYDMGLWLACQAVFELMIPWEDIILDGAPAATTAITELGAQTVANAMERKRDGALLIASSSMPFGAEATGCVTSERATTAWKLCELTSATEVGHRPSEQKACWSSAAERGSVFVFSSATPCHGKQ
jgi:hypothetical protein